MHDHAKPDSDEKRDAQPDSVAVKRLRSDHLFGAAREIEIEHAGRVYRMRITQSGKLILTA
jgi:hemin uptake protein HemP